MAGGRRENQNLEQHMSRQMEASPRDLLRRFGIGTETAVAVKEEATAEEVELSLGLSLGGSFGVDPAAKKGLGLGLVRASSVASFSFFPQKEEEEEEDGKEFTAAAGAGNHHPLMRACSLPAETGEEQRKKKEMQSLRRLEAKRKREEKRGRRPEEGCGEIRHMERVAFTNGSTSSPPLPRRRRHQQHNHAHGLSPPPIACRLPTTPTPPLPLPLPLAAEVSTSSSDYDCRPMQGLDISGQSSTKPEAKSPPRMKSFAKQTEQKPAAVFPNTLTTGNSTRKMSVEETLMKAPIEGNGSKEMTRPTIEEMPCVSTDGPDGKRIEGFLCKYSKGEEVRIMCVCHGSFLSPAEFVKHAGGGDVEFPLRHIVVYPSAQAFL